MRSNYDVLGKHIRLVDFRNKDEVTNTVLGISINKEFMPSVANVIGTDLSRYKLIQKGMWFRRIEFDRECWFMTDGSVRGGITWDDLCRIRIPVPSIEKQRSIVKAYQTITNRIALKQKINDNLAA